MDLKKMMPLIETSIEMTIGSSYNMYLQRKPNEGDWMNFFIPFLYINFVPDQTFLNRSLAMNIFL